MARTNGCRAYGLFRTLRPPPYFIDNALASLVKTTEVKAIAFHRIVKTTIVVVKLPGSHDFGDSPVNSEPISFKFAKAIFYSNPNSPENFVNYIAYFKS